MFSERDFDWSFRMRAGDAQRFFSPTSESESIRKHKSSRLALHPDRYLRETPAARVLVEDLASLASSWNLIHETESADLKSLGLQLEPDLLLVEAESLALAAACVCMPSSWSIDHAIGKSVHEVHQSVPRLNERIGKQIDRFLRSIPPGKSFCRENWSITLTDQLDYHPDLQRKRPDRETPLNQLHLRLEHQLFTALPHGLLMGIRISTISFSELRKDPENWGHFAKTIGTMPDNVAEYKGMLGYRSELAQSMRTVV